jgi:hypothetical protein
MANLLTILNTSEVFSFSSILNFIKTEPVLFYLSILTALALVVILFRTEWILYNCIPIFHYFVHFYAVVSYIPILACMLFSLLGGKPLFSNSPLENSIFSFQFATGIFLVFLFTIGLLIKIKKIKKYEIKLLVTFTIFMMYFDFLILFKLSEYKQTSFLILGILLLIFYHLYWLLFLLRKYKLYFLIRTVYDSHLKILERMNSIENFLIPSSVNAFGEILKLCYNPEDHNLLQDIMTKSVLFVDFARSLRTSDDYTAFRNHFNNLPLSECLDNYGSDYALDRSFFSLANSNLEVAVRLYIFEKMLLKYISDFPTVQLYDKNIKLAMEFDGAFNRLRACKDNQKQARDLILKYQNYTGFSKKLEVFKNEYLNELEYLIEMNDYLSQKMFKKLISHLNTSLIRFQKLESIFKEGIKEIEDFESGNMNK